MKYINILWDKDNRYTYNGFNNSTELFFRNSADLIYFIGVIAEQYTDCDSEYVVEEMKNILFRVGEKCSLTIELTQDYDELNRIFFYKSDHLITVLDLGLAKVF